MYPSSRKSTCVALIGTTLCGYEKQLSSSSGYSTTARAPFAFGVGRSPAALQPAIQCSVLPSALKLAIAARPTKLTSQSPVLSTRAADEACIHSVTAASAPSRAQRAATWGRLALWYTRVEFGLKNASKSTSVRTAPLALGLQRTSASR